jgi:hypothetical protein
MTAQTIMSLPQQPTDAVIKDKLERVLRALNDPDIEPHAHVRLTLEADRLRGLLYASMPNRSHEASP